MPKTDSGFATLALRPELIRTLGGLGYEEPTPIQEQAIPPLLEGRDLIGQAATGTGKTAAFALPILERLAELGPKRETPTALILVPTRELAMQVAEAIHRYGRFLPASVLPVYGGQAYGPQLGALRRGVDVVVATPGRALDHVRRGTLVLERMAVVVLDEADEMLDMGFAEDIETLLSATPEERQTVLFSATMPARIGRIAKRFLRDPVHIQIETKLPKGEAPKVEQRAYVVQRAYKQAALSRVLDVESPDKALIFCRTRNEVDALTETLRSRGYRAEALHGGLSQTQRDRVLAKLRRGGSDLVVATDVAARGLDIEELSHVVNFDAPPAVESYTHRIGRVGRAGREGVAITLVEPREHRLLRDFERATRQKIRVAPVPTIADLRARRLELTRASLREALLEGDLDGFRVVVESLAEEFDLFDIAAAGVKLVHQASGGDAEPSEEIPAVRMDRDRPTPKARAPKERGFKSAGPMTKLFVGVGRRAGVRPADLVGAIAGESGISGRAIGAIEIGERSSLVEISASDARTVIEALGGAHIKGKKVVVRLYKGTATRSVKRKHSS
ncbi:MAG: DEAD/DEAH box helicase [Myxococcales bacterium]|nr:DEAD/DEAH box helicase [Myxococcales bacterium]MCB9582653.1 DEAD/DEAH box helicase [Polyangiaceae bacterium]